MNPTLTEPGTIVLLCLITGFVVGLYLTLLGLLRGDRRVHEESAKWVKAVGGGRAGRAEQDAQLEALHKAVQQLRSPDSTPDSSPRD